MRSGVKEGGRVRGRVGDREKLKGSEEKDEGEREREREITDGQ